MRGYRNPRLTTPLAAAALLALSAAAAVGLKAGGPLILREAGEPLLWGGNPPTVVLRFDSGSMGSLTPAQTLAHQQAAARAWTDIPTSSITLVDGGPAEFAIGPQGQGDFALENILAVLGVNNGGITPLVIDNEDINGNGNGDLFDALGFGAGVLGVASPEFATDGIITEGLVLINGQSISPGDVDGSQFRGVLVHELGHMLNLAHTVVNGQAVFFSGTDALYPDGTLLGADVEHVETMYPFIATATGGSGVFQAQPHLDDIAAISTLYPQPGALEAAGSLGGLVLSGLGTPRTGFHVISRNRAGDPLRDAVSAISGDLVQSRTIFGELTGRYLLNMLTPGGQYSLELRETRGGGFSTDVFRTPDGTGDRASLVPGPEEFFSGPDEDHTSPPDDPAAAPFLVDIQAGGPAQAAQADFRINEFTVPDNDNCAAALPVQLSELPFQDIRSTRAAGIEDGEEESDCGFGNEDRSVWYSIENDTAELKQVNVTTALSDYFNVIQVLDGDCASLQKDFEACDRTVFPRAGSDLQLAVEPGQSRFLRVADSGLVLGSGGDLVVTIFESPPPPSNDVCGEALVIDSLPFLADRDVSSARTESNEPNLICVLPVGTNSVWYTYTHNEPTAESLLLSTRGSDYNTVVQIYQGSCGQLTGIQPENGGCDDNSGPGLTSTTSFEALPGTTYMIKAAAVNDVGGNLRLSLQRVPDTPANDDCVRATTVQVSQLPFLDESNTLRAGNEANEPTTTCGSESTPEQSKSLWYRVINDTALPAEVLLSTEGSEFTNVLQVYKGFCSAFLPLQCDAFSGTGITGRTSVNVPPQESIWIKTAAFGSSDGGRATFRAEQLNPVLRGDLQVALSRLEERLTTAREPLALGASITNGSAQPASNVALTLQLPRSTEQNQVTSETGQCQADITPENSFTCRWAAIAPGEEVLAEVSSVPRTGGEVDLLATIDWTEAPAGQAGGQVVLTSQVRPFLIFPARLSSETPTLFDGTFVGLAVVNTTENSQDLVLQGLGILGDSTFITDPAAILEPRGQTALTSGQAGPVDPETESIAARGQDELNGFFMAGDFSLQRLDGIGRQLQEGRDLVFPLVQEDAEHQTQLYLFNPSPESNPLLDLKLFDASGALVAERSFGFRSNSTFLAPVANLFESPQVEQGYITLHAPHPMKGFVFVASQSSMIAAAAQAPEAAIQLSAPHYLIDNQGADTTLRLYNDSQGELAVRGTIFNEAGLAQVIQDFTIGPKEMFVSDLTDLFGIDAGPSGMRTGHVRFDLLPTEFVGFFGPLARVIGSLEFRTAEERTRSVLPLRPAVQGTSRFFQVAQSADVGMFTGLAIFNAFPSTFGDSTVTVRAFDSLGQLAAERIFALTGGRRVLGLLSDDTFFGPDFELVTGHIEIESSAPLVTFALFGDFQGQFLSAIEGQPGN